MPAQSIPVRIVNWNIQNFGDTKAGHLYGNGDVVAAIAQVVVELDADIFVMLEMNTTKGATAVSLAATMLKALQKETGGKQFPTCVLSSNTGLEFYAYFVKDPSRTTPILPVGVGGAAPPIAFGTPPALPAITSGVFTPVGAAGVLQSFPFVTPDLPRMAGGRALRTPGWTGRLPVAGLFEIKGASAANAVLPILACHFDPDPGIAHQQLVALQCVSLLAQAVTLSIAPSPITAPVKQTTTGWVLLGDFNIDVSDAKEAPLYAPITAQPPNGLGVKGQLASKTLLVTPPMQARERLNSTGSMAVKAIDEMFPAGSAVAVGAAQSRDIPERIMTAQQRQRIRICESVRHYAEMDKRGFANEDKSAYDGYVRNYANQLAGDKSNSVTPYGALLGARLISDHLPVLLTIQVT